MIRLSRDRSSLSRGSYSPWLVVRDSWCIDTLRFALFHKWIERLTYESDPPYNSGTYASLVGTLPGRLGWGGGCRIHRLLLYRGVRQPTNECSGYDTKQSDGEVPVILELRGMWSTPLLPSLPCPLWPEVVAPDKGHIYELNRTKPWFLDVLFFCI